jgi:hypothetical protein
MIRVLIAAAAIALAAAPNAFGATTTVTTDGAPCPPGQMVAWVTQDVSNDVATGVYGNVWALQSYTRTILIYKTGARTYCASTNSPGQFTSFAGVSPAATGYVEAGITGPMSSGTRTTNFTAKWRPLVPTSGSIGSIDLGCTASGYCARTADWTSLFFTDVSGYGVSAWRTWYYNPAYGRFQSRSDIGYYGDIVG